MATPQSKLNYVTLIQLFRSSTKLPRLTIKMDSREFKQRFMNHIEFSRFVFEMDSCDFDLIQRLV